VKNLVVVPNVLLAYGMPLVVGWAYIWWPVLARVTLPEYLPGLRAVQIFTLAIFFMSFGGSGNFLVAIGKQHEYVAILALGTLANGALTCVMLRVGMEMEGVAVAAVIAAFLQATVLNLYVLSHFGSGLQECIRFLAHLYMPFVYMVGVLWTLERVFVHVAGGSMGGDLGATFLMALGYTMAVAPLCVSVQRKTGLPLELVRVVRGMLVRGC
jgi:hypothetical protein